MLAPSGQLPLWAAIDLIDATDAGPDIGKNEETEEPHPKRDWDDG
jgi:hypothetical protein